MYAEDGQLHTSNTDLVCLEGCISLVVKSANAWYENNRIITALHSIETLFFCLSRFEKVDDEYIKELKAKGENENTKNSTEW